MKEEDKAALIAFIQSIPAEDIIGYRKEEEVPTRTIHSSLFPSKSIIESGWGEGVVTIEYQTGAKPRMRVL